MSRYFETIKIKDKKIFNLAYHQRRYESCVKNALDLKEVIKPLKKDGLFRCKVIYDENEILDISYFEYKKREISTLKLVDGNNLDYSKKYLDRSNLDRLFLQRDGCDDILIVKNSYITDTTIANVALLKDDIWFTPKQPLLAGTTRQRLLDSKKLVLKDIKVDEIYEYEKIALLNAMIDFDIITQDNLKDIIC